MNNVDIVLKNIERCLFPKLGKNFDETENHPAFDIRNKNIEVNFQPVLKCLGEINFTRSQDNNNLIAAVYNLYQELISDGFWCNKEDKEYANKLNYTFEHLTGIPLKNVLQKNETFDHQVVFDKCLEDLHLKLTSEDYNKYPVQIEVYCAVIQDLKDYKVEIQPSKILPISMYLIEDYLPSNKIKGLKSCCTILDHLNAQHFKDGNYYEVVYRCLRKVLFEKDIDITKLTYGCLLKLVEMLPSDEMINKFDDLYSNVLDQLYTESNLYRKAECLMFVTKIIKLNKVNCISRNSFKAVITDCVDLCSHDGVSEILLIPTLKCLEVWLKYCWCIWKFSADQKLLMYLFKILYSSSNEHAVLIQKCIVTLIELCNANEQELIMNNLNDSNTLNEQEFQKRIDIIKKSVHV